MPACLWVLGFGFFLEFNDLEKEGILIWVWGCKKERIFVSSFGFSKGWIFGLGVAMLLRWVVDGSAFFFFLFFFFSSMCIALAFVESDSRSGGSWRQLLVESWSFGHGGVGGLC